MKKVTIDLDEAMDRLEAKEGKRPSMTDVAQMLGMNGYKTLHNWKNGNGLETVRKIKHLAKISNMPMEELIKDL